MQTGNSRQRAIRDGRHRASLMPLLVVACAGLIFIFDYLMPLGVAGGVPYVFLVLLGVWFPKKQHIFLIALLGSVLTVAGYFMSPSGGVLWVVLSNRLMAILVIWMTAVLLYLHRKSIESRETVSAERDLIRHYLDTIQALIIAIDNDGVIRFINKKGCEILGYDKQSLIGENWFELCLPIDMQAEIKQVFAQVISGDIEGVEEYESLILTKHHQQRTLRFFNNYLSDCKGNITGSLSAAYDVTDFNEMQARLQESKEYAVNANDAKSEYISRISHELRTPLNAIIGFSQLIKINKMGKQEQEQEQEQEYNDEIYCAGQHLLGLIDDVLNLSHIESGKISLIIEDVHLASFIDECIALIAPLAKQHQIKIDNRISESLPGFVKADPIRLKEAMLNLMSNAVKYSREAGSMMLMAKVVANNRVRLTVADNGEGLSVGQQRQLFTPFERLAAAQSDIEGTGIGLVISKKLIELMDGQIGVISEPEQGSKFWIELPYADHSENRVIDQQHKVFCNKNQQPARGKSILYIEDNPVNIKLAESIIASQTDYQLISVDTPKKGVELALKIQPDLILLDMQLPQMDGYETFKKLQSVKKTSHIPVIALSANAMVEDINRAIKQGFSGYITKPMDVPNFLQTLSSHLEN